MDIGFTMSVPERKKNEMTFDEAFYFMVITTVTVGYGDILPATDEARIIISFFIILMIVIVSKQTSELNELMKYNFKYKLPYKGKNNDHVILIGNITPNSLFKFCKEFFHPDHKIRASMKILIVQEKEPEKDMISVLDNPRYEGKIQYMIGNIFKENVMKSAKINKESKVLLFFLLIIILS